MGGNSFAFNSQNDSEISNFFYWWITFQLCTRQQKIRFPISKIQGRERKKLDLIARYKNWFYFYF
jgi:hypothetical protein